MNHGRYASRDDDHAFLARLVEQAAVETAAGLGGEVGLVLGGSLARSEGTVWRPGGIPVAGGPVALSDIDLAAVLPDAAARDRVAAKAPALRAGIAARLEQAGLRGGFDLGVYAPEDLGRQGPRPGTLEYRRSGRVLLGPENLTAGFPALEEKDVPPEEALVLLENRGAELLLAWPGAGPEEGSRALAALYAGMKTVLDGAFALVVQSGSCPASGKARQAALESWTTVEGRSETLRAVLPDFVEDVKFWGAMKEAPDAAAIALRLGVPDPTDVVQLGRRAWREGARAWTGCYRIVASRQFGVAGLPDVHRLALHAAHRARFRRRVRRWAEASRAYQALDRAGRARWALRPRLGLALQGAPEHELAACVAVLIEAWSDPAGAPDFRPAMNALFPGAPPERLDWDRCRRAAVLLWDTLESGGTRTAREVPMAFEEA